MALERVVIETLDVLYAREKLYVFLNYSKMCLIVTIGNNEEKNTIVVKWLSQFKSISEILLMFCSSNRQLLLCGMHSGSIRVYPLQPGDHSLTSMQAYWALSIHDNHYGHLRHICCSHDDLFVLTAGDDGNIFSFSLIPPEELQKSLHEKKAKIPSPRVSSHSLLYSQ